MSEPFLGEIRMFGFGWPPVHWALCDGTLLTAQQQPALFSLLGDTYGGNVQRSTFALPDLRGRVPLHRDDRDNSGYPLGEKSGVGTVTLTEATLPRHTHAFGASPDLGSKVAPPLDSAVLARSSPGEPSYTQPRQLVSMNAGTGSAAGGGAAHSNIQPSLAIGFCIAMAGIYPPRP